MPYLFVPPGTFNRTPDLIPYCLPAFPAARYPYLQTQRELLGRALTAQLYQAAWGSAALAYYDAYLDTVIGVVLYFNRFVRGLKGWAVFTGPVFQVHTPLLSASARCWCRHMPTATL